MKNLTLNENEIVVKKLSGFSLSDIYLIEKDNTLFIRKINEVDRNFKQLTILHQQGYPVPKIYNISNQILDMEYIHGLDIKTYIKFNKLDNLINFIIEIIDKMSETSQLVDYSDVYNLKLNEINYSQLPFTQKELFDKLPKLLPRSQYHGDLTLENIIYSTVNKFYLIDAVSIEYDSWVFDIAKMRQDLQCKWFLRNENLFFDTQLDIIQTKILNKFPQANNDYLLILMLLRVYKRSIPESKEHKFLLEEIKKLWK